MRIRAGKVVWGYKVNALRHLADYCRRFYEDAWIRVPGIIETPTGGRKVYIADR